MPDSLQMLSMMSSYASFGAPQSMPFYQPPMYPLLPVMHPLLTMPGCMGAGAYPLASPPPPPPPLSPPLGPAGRPPLAPLCPSYEATPACGEQLPVTFGGPVDGCGLGGLLPLKSFLDSKVFDVRVPVYERFHVDLIEEQIRHCLHFNQLARTAFTPLAGQRALSAKQHVAAVLNVSRNDRMYDSQRLRRQRVESYFMPGYERAGAKWSDASLCRFFRLVQFLGLRHRRQLVLVHCTTGVHTTGPLLCAFLMVAYRLSAEQAISLFGLSRGHQIEDRAALAFLKALPNHIMQSTRRREQFEQAVQIPTRADYFKNGGATTAVPAKLKSWLLKKAEAHVRQHPTDAKQPKTENADQPPLTGGKDTLENEGVEAPKTVDVDTGKTALAHAAIVTNVDGNCNAEQEKVKPKSPGNSRQTTEAEADFEEGECPEEDGGSAKQTDTCSTNAEPAHTTMAAKEKAQQPNKDFGNALPLPLIRVKSEPVDVDATAPSLPPTNEGKLGGAETATPSSKRLDEIKSELLNNTALDGSSSRSDASSSSTPASSASSSSDRSIVTSSSCCKSSVPSISSTAKESVVPRRIVSASSLSQFSEVHAFPLEFLSSIPSLFAADGVLFFGPFSNASLSPEQLLVLLLYENNAVFSLDVCVQSDPDVVDAYPNIHAPKLADVIQQQQQQAQQQQVANTNGVASKSADAARQANRSEQVKRPKRIFAWNIHQLDPDLDDADEDFEDCQLTDTLLHDQDQPKKADTPQDLPETTAAEGSITKTVQDGETSLNKRGSKRNARKTGRIEIGTDDSMPTTGTDESRAVTATSNAAAGATQTQRAPFGETSTRRPTQAGDLRAAAAVVGEAGAGPVLEEAASSDGGRPRTGAACLAGGEAISPVGPSTQMASPIGFKNADGNPRAVKSKKLLTSRGRTSPHCPKNASQSLDDLFLRKKCATPATASASCSNAGAPPAVASASSSLPSPSPATLPPSADSSSGGPASVRPGVFKPGAPKRRPVTTVLESLERHRSLLRQLRADEQKAVRAKRKLKSLKRKKGGAKADAKGLASAKNEPGTCVKTAGQEGQNETEGDSSCTVGGTVKTPQASTALAAVGTASRVEAICVKEEAGTSANTPENPKESMGAGGTFLLLKHHPSGKANLKSLAASSAARKIVVNLKTKEEDGKLPVDAAAANDCRETPKPKQKRNDALAAFALDAELQRRRRNGWLVFHWIGRVTCGDFDTYHRLMGKLNIPKELPLEAALPPGDIVGLPSVFYPQLFSNSRTMDLMAQRIFRQDSKTKHQNVKALHQLGNIKAAGTHGETFNR
eukprot:GHVT01062541.1.p1 GENE.GHVT01062541.1~~GHVT01062541.1.p1  ORF type:complete len:1517 (+),score=332.10 GHVT01062541.1:632-4552(+)